MGFQHSQEHREKIRQALLARGKGRQDKRCSSCELVKPRSQFGLRPNGYSRSACLSCDLAAAKAWRKANPQKVQALNQRTNLKRYYGITEADYTAMFNAQGGVCAICRKPPNASTHARLYVDHCHGTSRIRGLLCNGCNRGIGYMHHEVARLRAAADYLLSPPANLIAEPQLPSGKAKYPRKRKDE